MLTEKNLLPPGGLISVVFTDFWFIYSCQFPSGKVLHSNISSLFEPQIILFLLCTSTYWDYRCFCELYQNWNECLYLPEQQTRAPLGLCGGERVEENDRVDGIKAIDPLLQLITLFGQTALMESRCVCVHFCWCFHCEKVICVKIYFC